jgi:ribosomal protein S18 acetylase RimI-like enzyme
VIIIRPYDEADEAAVIAFWREVFPEAPPWNDPREDIRRKLRVQRKWFLVASLESSIVGTAMAGYDGHRGWLYYVGVSEAHRRLGVGSLLLRRIEQELAVAGCPKLNLQVRARNPEAVAFYESLGFQVEERVSMGKLLIRDPEPAHPPRDASPVDR